MGILTRMGLVLGTGFRRYAVIFLSGLTVAMLFLFAGKSNRIMMLSHNSVFVQHLAPMDTPIEEATGGCSGAACNSTGANNRSSCKRLEVYVVLDGNASDIFRAQGKESSEGLLSELLAPSECRLVSLYHIRIVYYKDRSLQTPLIETLKRVNESLQVCAREGSVVQLDYFEIADRSQDVWTLSLLMRDGYVLKDIDCTSVIFASHFTDSAVSQAPLTRFIGALDAMVPKNVGVVFQMSSSRVTPGRFFFSRNHFEIFGFFFPQAIPDLQSATVFLRQLYPASLIATVANEGVEKTLTTGTAVPQPPMSPYTTDLLEYNATLYRYLSASASNPCLRCRNNSSRMVIAMSLYGDGHRYTMGAIRNAQLLPVIFPGWRLWFYVEKPNPGGTSKYGLVPREILSKLEDLGAEIIGIDPVALGLAPMLWRFTVMDNETVDVFTVRDCDSRLTPRDAAVIADWLKTDRMFHCIRDHPSHSNYALSGGLWGARRKPLETLVGSLRTVMQRYGAGYVEDMHFLGQVVWPKVKDVAYCHDSFSCERFPSSHPFPVVRIGFEHLGQVYDEHSKGRQGDMNILRNSAVNKACVPA